MTLTPGGTAPVRSNTPLGCPALAASGQELRDGRDQ